jgi:hypothetical protein
MAAAGGEILRTMAGDEILWTAAAGTYPISPRFLGRRGVTRWDLAWEGRRGSRGQGEATDIFLLPSPFIAVEVDEIGSGSTSSLCISRLQQTSVLI